jgi:nudix-type nucleoside diphosphatase (YffH/AdpP family)
MQEPMTGTLTDNFVRIRTTTTLAEGRYVLQMYTFDYLRRDGSWQRLSREVYKRGDSAVVLLYCPSRGTVVLTRQFRLPVFVNGGCKGMLVEAPAGLIDHQAPSAAIQRETMEETGIHIARVEEVFVAYMSPQLISGRTYFYVAEYRLDDWISPGGGVASEGEDIEAFEVSFEEAITMFKKGQIEDAKTILLLLYAKTQGLLQPNVRRSDT